MRTANHHFSHADRGGLFTFAGSNITITFDTSTQLTNGWWVDIKNIGAQNVTVNPGAARKLGGSTAATSGTLRPGDIWRVFCDGMDLPLNRLAGSTVILLTSGTSYVPEPGVTQLRVRAVGGGGGGATGGSEGNPATGGGHTYFGSLTATGGGPGSGTSGGGGGGGGGPGSTFGANGRSGVNGHYGSYAYVMLTRGGLSALLGYGDGGGGGTEPANNGLWSGGGGGSGGYVEGRLPVTPGVPVSYSIGAGGTGGSSTHTWGQAGLQGAIVIEFT